MSLTSPSIYLSQSAYTEDPKSLIWWPKATRPLQELDGGGGVEPQTSSYIISGKLNSCYNVEIIKVF